MKYLTKLIFTSALILNSCAAGLFVVNAHMGMTESEFRSQNWGEKVVSMKDGVTIYHMYNTDGSYMYYTFKNGKLVEIWR